MAHRGKRNPNVLTAMEVARLMNVSYRTFLLRRARGDAPPPFNGVGRPQYSRETVLAWLRRGAQQVA